MLTLEEKVATLLNNIPLNYHDMIIGNSYIGMGGWNGGGSGTLIKGDGYGSGGGGSTDIRLSSSLSDRIVVAGGGGGWGYCKVCSELTVALLLL
jgi:hypothetical protein